MYILPRSNQTEQIQESVARLFFFICEHPIIILLFICCCLFAGNLIYGKIHS